MAERSVFAINGPHPSPLPTGRGLRSARGRSISRVAACWPASPPARPCPGAAWPFDSDFRDSAAEICCVRRARRAKDLLDLCIRCGECMKVCPTNVLQPTIFRPAWKVYSRPRLVPRFVFEQSYCEYTCTLCGQVCPTGAIPRLTEEKNPRPISKAYFDHQLCLPWAEKTPCIRCRRCVRRRRRRSRLSTRLRSRARTGGTWNTAAAGRSRLMRRLRHVRVQLHAPGTAGIRVQRLQSPRSGHGVLAEETASSIFALDFCKVR